MFDNFDLGKDEIRKLFVKFAVPAIIGMLAMTTAGLIDSFFVGNYIGALGISAITLVVPILNIMMGIAAMIVSGGVVLAGLAYGNKNLEESNNIFNVTFWLVVVLGAAMMLFIGLFGNAITTDLLNLSGLTSKYVSSYLMILNVFIPAYLLVFFFSLFLKLDGMPTIIVVGTLSGVFINIVLDYLFIAVFDFGMKGSAMATGLSQALPCIFFIVVTLKKSIWKFKKPKFHMEKVKMIFFNGSSEFLGLSSVGIAGYIYNLIIARKLGIDGVSAFGIAMQVAGIATMVYYGISDAIQSIISYNFGAKLYDRVNELRALAFKSSFIFGLGLAVILIGFGKEISSIFIDEVEIIELSSNILVYYAIAMIIAGINLNASTFYTAIGEPVKSAIIAVVRSLLALVVGLLILPQIFEEPGLWLPLIFTEIVTSILVLFYMRTPINVYGDRLNCTKKNT